MIQDFAAGVDRIDLSAIDARASAGGDQSFTLVSGFLPLGEGQMRVSYDMKADRTVVEFNNDADQQIEFHLELVGNVQLTAADFML